ncbi:MAG: HD domain-containing protein [Clostridia bacterium]|nr:HD domain-containing protein [Clostridia bacterium]
MERIDLILNNQIFQTVNAQIRECEQERIFCRHDVGHFLDVARIMMILYAGYEEAQKQTLLYTDELIYATALLHDMGRAVQYETGIPHEEAGVTIARDILLQTQFCTEEIRLILDAIRNHRNCEIKNNRDLNGLLYQADKASRACFCCQAENECNWKNDKKNLTIIY